MALVTKLYFHDIKYLNIQWEKSRKDLILCIRGKWEAECEIRLHLFNLIFCGKYYGSLFPPEDKKIKVLQDEKSEFKENKVTIVTLCILQFWFYISELQQKSKF